MLDDFADEVADIVKLSQADTGAKGTRLSELFSRQKVCWWLLRLGLFHEQDGATVHQSNWLKWGFLVPFLASCRL